MQVADGDHAVGHFSASLIARSDLWRVQLGYHPTANNGNIDSQTITAPGLPATLSQGYTYDPLNRLFSAVETGSWSRSFGYDRYGNRSITASTGLPTMPGINSFSTATNRLTTASYDADGNMTIDPAGGAMTYDAENRMTLYTDPGMAIDDTVYGYDGEGRRVKKTNVLSGNRTIYIYDTFGKLAAEYFEGTPTATVGTFYRTLDHLGSTRVVTDASGTEASRLDYTPFGELVPTSLGGRTSSPGYDTDAGIRQKFTGKERDDESTLDFFLARYYSASMGRFLSSDTTGYSSIRQPGSWNLYAYALNNPLKFNDPTGHIVELASCSTIGNCQRELAAIQSALASDEAAGRLTVQELKGKRSFLDRLLGREAKSKFTVAIEGDVGEFRGLSANAGRIGALIESESVVSFSLSNIRRDPGGGLRPVAGGFSGLPSQGFNPAQVVVRSDGQTARFDQDTRGIIGGQVGRIPGASFSETVAHEFGHPFAEIIKGHPAGSIANKREAVLSENEVRRTDPERGFKIRHGVQVLRQGDLPQ